MSARVMLMVILPRLHEPSIAGFAQFGEKWWLVEAESDDAARKVIEHFERDPDATCAAVRALDEQGGER